MDDQRSTHAVSEIALPEILATEQAPVLPIHPIISHQNDVKSIPTDPYAPSTSQQIGPTRSKTPENASEAAEEEEHQSPPPPKLSRIRLFLIASTATMCLFISSAGVVALNIALPTIQKDLNMASTDLQWIASAYSLANGCFLLLAGRMADVHGRKLVFLVGVGWNGLWTLIGGFMKSGAGLVVTRALAGSGAAISLPSGIGMIAVNFEGKSRSTAFAAFASGAPTGAALGMVLGGVLTTYAPTTWRACLWVIAAVSFAIFVVGFLVFPSDIITTSDRRIDWIGAILVTVGLVLLQFVISDALGAPHGWKTSWILVLLFVSLIILVAFFFWERHVINNTSRPPLMRLQLWTRAHGRLAAVYMIGFVSWMGFISHSYHATLFYQQAQGLDPLQALLRFLPMPVSGVLCAFVVANLVRKVPTQWLVAIGVTCTGVANIIFATAPVDGSYWAQPFNAMWLNVVGADFLMATGQLFVSRLSLPDEVSVAGALFQTLVQLGGAFGLALTTVIAASIQDKSTQQGKPYLVSLVDGIHAAFYLGAGMSFAALIISVIALRGMGTIGKGVQGPTASSAVETKKPAKTEPEEPEAILNELRAAVQRNEGRDIDQK